MNILIILLPQYYYYKLLQPLQRDRYCLAKRKILDHPREKMFFVFIFTSDSSFLVKIKLHGKSLTAFFEFCLVVNNEMKPFCGFGSIAFKEFSINFNRLWEEVGNLSNISFLILIVLFRHFIKKALNSNILVTQRDKYYFSDAFSVGFPVIWLKKKFPIRGTDNWQPRGFIYCTLFNPLIQPDAKRGQRNRKSRTSQTWEIWENSYFGKVSAFKIKLITVKTWSYVSDNIFVKECSSTETKNFSL